MWSLLGGNYYEKGRRVRMCKQLPEDFNNTRQWKLKQEALYLNCGYVLLEDPMEL
jgi:hypothetical protein